MANYNTITEVSANVVNITTGGIQKNYNKTDLKVSKTDQQVFVYYYTDGTNKTVASWNEFQAQAYGYTLSELKSRIDGILVSTTPTFSGLNISSVPEYASQTDAIADGLKNGDVYRLPKASDNRLLAVVFALIDYFTAGKTQIDFTNNVGDDWTVGFKIAPISLQAPPLVTVDSYDWAVTFWSAGTDTALGNSATPETADFDFDTTGNGAGVYDLDITYNLSDGSTLQVTKLVKVDASGTVIASVEGGGTTVNSVNGLVIDLSADITQVGVNYPIRWGASPIGILPQTGADVVLTLPLGTTNIVTLLTLDSVFTSDYSGGGSLVFTSITIS